ncbi:MAG: hypothetical protein O3B64_00950 [bacterium]|nr:hypothetical protein [bacterium]
MAERPTFNPEIRELHEGVKKFEIVDVEGNRLGVCESVFEKHPTNEQYKVLQRCELTAANGEKIDLLQMPDGERSNVEVLFVDNPRIEEQYLMRVGTVVLVNRDMTSIDDIAVLLHEMGHDEQARSSDGFSEVYNAMHINNDLPYDDFSRAFRDLSDSFRVLYAYIEMVDRDVPMHVKLDQDLEEEIRNAVAEFKRLHLDDAKESDRIKKEVGRGYLEWSEDEERYNKDHLAGIRALSSSTESVLKKHPKLRGIYTDMVLWQERDASDRARARLNVFVEQGMNLVDAKFPLTDREIAMAENNLTHKSRRMQEATRAYLEDRDKTIDERLKFSYQTYECTH